MIPAQWVRVRVWNAAGELLHDTRKQFREVSRTGYRRAQHTRELRTLQRRYACIWQRIDIEPATV